jgi:DNA adenine methylase
VTAAFTKESTMTTDLYADETPPAPCAKPLKWHGGKEYLAKWIISLMPRHLYYVEPYFGGGSVLFTRDPRDRSLWWDGPTSDGRRPDGVIESANDIDADLVNFYSVLKDRELSPRLRDHLELTLCHEREWQKARDYLAAAGADPVARAAALFVWCRQSRAGQMRDFTTPVRTRLRGGRCDPVNAWLSAVSGLDAVHRRLRDVYFHCRPALEVIRSEDGPATLFYCDPPYLPVTRAAKGVYRYEMSEADHRELLAVLLGVKGKVILSGYPSELYDDTLRAWNRHTKEFANHASGESVKRRMTEVLWCNF